MRIVFTTWAWPSHLYAMVPLAWACRASGHEVLVASQPELTGVILRTGLPAVAVGRDVDAAATFRAIALTPPPAAHPVGGAAAPSGLAGPAPGLAAPASGPAGPQPSGGGPRVLGLLVALADAMVDDLIEVARDWRADLIVFEPTAFAGPLAAAAAGIPAVRHLYGTDLMSVVGRFLPVAFGPLRERLGLENVQPFGVATVDPCPAGLQVPVGSRRLPSRYVPYNGPGVLPPLQVTARPVRLGRPRVCVTWGTTMSRLDPRFFLAGDVARAISNLDVEVVVAITPAQRALLGALPPAVRVAESVPLHVLLPACDLVVAHGGAGTLLTGLASGLPQLLLPRLPDHVRHSGRLAEAGAGIVLPVPAAGVPGPDTEVIRDRLAELLSVRSYQTAARRLQDEMHAQPTPAQVVFELEQIVAGAAEPFASRSPDRAASL